MVDYSLFFGDKARSLVKKPKLYLLIAEDDVDSWGKRFKTFFETGLNEWCFCKKNQIEKPVVEVIKTLETFQERLNELIARGEMVYATLDMSMPEKEGQDQSDVSKELIRFCSEHKSNTDRENRFNFCIISGEDDILKKMEGDKRTEILLKNWGIDRIKKHDLFNPDTTDDIDDELYKILGAIKGMILKNIRYCVYPDPWNPEQEYVHWVGKSADLIYLMIKADDMIKKNTDGVILLFSDGKGYEDSWLYLYCYLNCLDFVEIDLSSKKSSGNLKELPQTLFIRNAEKCSHSQKNITNQLRDSKFFEHYTSGSKNTVFIQFPILETELMINQLKEDSKNLFYAYTSHVYGRTFNEIIPPPPGIGFALPEHERTIQFPCADRLAGASMNEHTIILLEALLKEKYPGRELDVEMSAVLAGTSWDEAEKQDDHRDLLTLQNAIIEAYESDHQTQNTNHLPGTDTYKRKVDYKDFESHIKKKFNSDEGLLYRGNVIYHYLKENSGSPTSSDLEHKFNPEQALKGLNGILELFKRLEDLMTSYEKSGPEKICSKGFGLKKYNALKRCHIFLVEVFNSPSNLNERINIFANDILEPDCMQNYPVLEAREGWNHLVQKIKFEWPFEELPLHFEIYKYLRTCEVKTEIIFNDKVLERYPDLKEQVDLFEADCKKKKEDFGNQLIKNQKERRKVEAFINKKLRNPISVHLLTTEEKDRDSNMKIGFQVAMLCYVHVAIAENAFFHEKSRVRIDRNMDLNIQYDVTSVTNNITLLCGYLAGLKKNKPSDQPSVFQFWNDNWPQKQPYALFLLGHLALTALNHDHNENYTKKILAQLADQDATGSYQLKTVAELAEERMPVEIVLRFIASIFEKKDTILLAKYGPGIFDCFRRFLFLVSNKKTGLGVRRNDGQAPEHWSPSRKYKNLEPDHAMWMFIDGKKYFPINSLKVRPGSGSLWARIKDGYWCNLTKTTYSNEDLYLTAGPWLSESRDEYEYLLPPASGKTLPAVEIFISYNRQDLEEVHEIVGKLRSMGYKVWFDLTHATPGENYISELPYAVSKAHVGVICVGNELGTYQRPEITLLSQRHIEEKMTVIPLILSSCKNDTAIKQLGFLQTNGFIEMRDNRGDPYDLLKRGIERQNPFD